MSKKIYENDQYLNKDIPFIISNMIREYDIHSAGINIWLWKNAISKKEYNYLSSLEKSDRNIQTGLMMRENPKLSEILKSGFEEIRYQFMKLNNLFDEDILSIKKDAIFIINKTPIQTIIDNIEFVNKNTYTSYYYLNNIEFYYYVRDDKLDIKGISDVVLEQHQDYFLDFLKKVFKLAERSDTKIIRKKIREFSAKYKNFELDTEYYRELNYESLFKVYNFQVKGELLAMADISKSMIKDGFIDTSYNYMRYIIPLINIFF
jgi:hypothetical protein